MFIVVTGAEALTDVLFGPRDELSGDALAVDHLCDLMSTQAPHVLQMCLGRLIYVALKASLCRALCCIATELVLGDLTAAGVIRLVDPAKSSANPRTGAHLLRGSGWIPVASPPPNKRSAGSAEVQKALENQRSRAFLLPGRCG